MQCKGSRPFLRFCIHHAPKLKVSSFTKMCKYCEIKFSENILFRWRTVTQLKFESIPFLIITMLRVDSEDLRFLGETKCRFKNHHYNPKSLSLFLSKMRITITSGWIRNCVCARDSGTSGCSVQSQQFDVTAPAHISWMGRSNIVPRVSLPLAKKRDRGNEVKPEVVIILRAGEIAVFPMIYPINFQESLVVCDY